MSRIRQVLDWQPRRLAWKQDAASVRDNVMRAFHQLVFDEVIDGTNPAYTRPEFNALLGFADALTVAGYASKANANGASPTLTVTVEHSADQERWYARAYPINSVSLSTSSDLIVRHGLSGKIPY